MPDDAMATARLLSPDVHAEALGPVGVSAALETASRALLEPGRGGAVGVEVGVEVGLWEAGPGTDTDTEADEVFLVLSGAGTVRFEDGSELALLPGALVRLHEGDRTVWEITERLRKLYLT
jgi:uncharacterized cupin superfamily protein